jgi:hypothetical protein
MDPSLSGVSTVVASLSLRAFFEVYQHANFEPAGDISGGRKVPMAGKSVRSAGGALAASFRSSIGRSPLHCHHGNQEERESFTPDLNKLFLGMEARSPNTLRQKAITPKLLRYLIYSTNSAVINDPTDNAADLIVGAFFFAMRSCEYVKTPFPGKTKRVRLGCIHFLSSNRNRIPNNKPDLLAKAKFVTIVFEDQKNGGRFEARTHEKTKDRFLCPVICFGRAVQRVLKYNPEADELTPLSSMNNRKLKTDSITSTFTLNLIRKTCGDQGGKTMFGFDPMEIGNKSLRSGAAMSLFLMKHSSDRIMILGRWKSRAFLDYIRPQVIEWTSCLSGEMISFDNFTDLLEERICEPIEVIQEAHWDRNPECQRNHFNRMPAFD